MTNLFDCDARPYTATLVLKSDPYQIFGSIIGYISVLLIFRLVCLSC